MKNQDHEVKKLISKMGPMDQSDFVSVLGDGIPHITRSNNGRMKLVRMLRNKFGASYRDVPQARKLIKKLESETSHLELIIRLKGMTNG